MCMRTTISIVTALALAAAVNAQEKKPGPPPEAQQLMERARQAKEAGRYDEARELAEKARQIGERHHEGKPGFEKGAPERMEKVRHEIEELHRAGKHEEAERLEHRVKEAMEHRKEAPSKGAEGPEKLRHVAEAIGHLRAAGLNEQAEGLEKIARKLHEDIEHREHADQERHAEKHGKDGPPRKMEKPGQPPGNELHAMREQIEKMARSIEELRAQVNRRGSEEEIRRPKN